MGFTPNAQQEYMIDTILSGENFAGKAYAGSGKTSTVVAALDKLPRNKKALVIYFNSAARLEAQTRLAHLPNVKVATNHTYAYAAVGSKYGKRVGGRIQAKRVADLIGIPEIELSSQTLAAEAVAGIAMRTVSKFTQTRNHSITGWHVPFTSLRAFDGADIDALKEQIPGIATQIWADKCSMNGRLPIAHDDYLKMWAMSRNSWFFGRDLIIVDEGQDSNDVLMGVVLKHTKAQLGMIGDPYQNLYDWRGTVNGLELIPDAVQCALTHTHRFGGDVVTAANVFLTLLNADMPLTGNASMDSVITDEMEDADLVLNRTNAGVIGSAICEAERGRTFSIGGGTSAVKDLAVAAEMLMAGQPVVHPDLVGFTSWEEVKKATDNDPSFGDLKVLVQLVSEHGSEKLKEIADLAKPEGDAEVHISTVHKVKGLEAAKVRIGQDFAGPSSDDTGNQFMNASALMVAYVAVTRAKNQLCLGSLDWGSEYLSEHADEYDADMMESAGVM